MRSATLFVLLAATCFLSGACSSDTSVSADVVASAGKAKFREAALFTHRGLSGPAILQASSYWRHGDKVAIDFLPGQPPGWLRQAKRDEPRATIRRALARILPDRLAETLGDQLGLAGELANIPDKSLEAAERRLSDWHRVDEFEP